MWANVLAKFGHLWSTSGRHRPFWAKVGPTSGQTQTCWPSWAKLGARVAQSGQRLAHMLVVVVRPASAPRRPKSARLGPLWAESRRKLASTWPVPADIDAGIGLRFAKSGAKIAPTTAEVSQVWQVVGGISAAGAASEQLLLDNRVCQLLWSTSDISPGSPGVWSKNCPKPGQHCRNAAQLGRGEEGR